MLTIMEAVEHMIGELILLELFSLVQSKISSDFHDMQFAWLLLAHIRELSSICGVESIHEDMQLIYWPSKRSLVAYNIANRAAALVEQVGPSL